MNKVKSRRWREREKFGTGEQDQEQGEKFYRTGWVVGWLVGRRLQMANMNWLVLLSKQSNLHEVQNLTPDYTKTLIIM